MLLAVAGNASVVAERAWRILPVALTLTLLVLLAGFLVSTYFGNGRSPYGTCYGANGRAVPCEWIENP